MVQAKGYPDLLTQSFLQLINATNRHLPIMILVDCDPDGFNIFFCYRYGSNRQRQSSIVSVNWWGIKTGHVLNAGKAAIADGGASRTMRRNSSRNSSLGLSISSTACREPISQLSYRDRKLAISSLTKVNNLTQNDNIAEDLKAELQRMLMLGVKTEIQWLDESGSITRWLDREMGASLDVGNIDGV
jgi:meiotic recombination protein SPO11